MHLKSIKAGLSLEHHHTYASTKRWRKFNTTLHTITQVKCWRTAYQGLNIERRKTTEQIL